MTDTFQHQGHNFRIELVYDDTHGAPWDEEDGHGPVSEWTSRDKRPGEMILCQDRHSKRFYDFAAAVAIARAEGWDAAPYTGTRGERAARAAMRDFNRLREWCTDQWNYVGVVVHLLDDDGDDMNEAASLWGIESDDYDYHRDVAKELADEILDALAATIAA